MKIKPHLRPYPTVADPSCCGFVYLILNKTNKKFYIGQKQYWSRFKRPPLKGKLRARRAIRESDWKQYYGSSKALQQDIEQGHKVERYLLAECDSKEDLSYTEAWWIYATHAMLRSDSYNQFVGRLSIHLSHKKRL